MTPEDLGRVIAILERLSIPYMLTGSVASSYHGRPRSTHDADIVVDLDPEQLSELASALVEQGFYVNRDRAQRALAQRRQFNAIDMELACKIDLIVRKDRPFSIEEFSRRRKVDLAFRPQVMLVTAEDSILSKLEWARHSGDPSRQLRDVAGILELQTGIDRAYVEHWANELGVDDLWRQVGGAEGS